MTENDVNQNVSAPNLGEAGGVAWTEMYGMFADDNGDMQRVKINVTARAGSASLAVIELFEAIDLAKASYGLAPFMPTSKPAAAKQSEESFPNNAVVGGADPVDTAAVDNAFPAAGTHESKKGTVHSVKMEVLPQPSGKSKVSFYGEGRNFPDVSMTMLPEQLAGKLSTTGAWTPEHFTKAGIYTFACKVVWQDSDKINPYSKSPENKYYKNIVAIHPA